MDLQTKLLMICLIAIAASFVFAVIRIIGTWIEHHIERHDLVVASKQRRRDYNLAMAEQRKAEEMQDQDSGSVIIGDDEPAEPAPLAQAA